MADGGASTSEPATSGPATAQTATNATPPARWRLTGSVVASGLAVSAALHVALVGAVLVVGSWGRPPAPVKAVPVDVVTPDELDKMTEQAKKEPTPQPSLADTPGRGQQAPQAQPQQQATQQAQSPSPPLAQPASPPPPPSRPKLDAFAPPFPSSAAPSPDAPPPAPPTESIGQAAQLAQLLGLPAPVAGLSGGAPSDYKADLAADEIAKFAAHVQGCWTALPDAAKAGNLTVFIRVRLNRDGGLAGNPEPLGGSASMQALTLLQNALTTLKNCPAYTALPADKYDEWRVLDLHFTAGGLSTASRVSSSRR